jgi:hypothetical protein
MIPVSINTYDLKVYNKAFTFCCDHFGCYSCTWETVSVFSKYTTGYVFYFEKPNDAMLFKLRFG